MIGSPSVKNRLTVSVLRKDVPGYNLGYWQIVTLEGRHKHKYLIVQDSAGFALAKARPLTVLARSKTIEDIVVEFNRKTAQGEVTVR